MLFLLSYLLMNKYNYLKTNILIRCSVLPAAIDRAIKEIVSTVKKRSNYLATQTTKELILKVCFFY